MNIDDIYAKDIESIIASSKFDKIEDIFSQLGLEVINIANTKYKELEYLAKNEKFKISRIQDLFNKEKINYYYILFKYIFKPNSYFNNITLFKSFKDFLIKILKTQLYELLSNFKEDEIINTRMNYIIKNVLNSEYYYNRYLKTIDLIKFYYKNKFNKSKKDEIKSIELKFKNNNLNYSESPLPSDEIEKFYLLLFIDTFTYEINIRNKYIFEEQFKVGKNNIIYEDKFIKYIRKKLFSKISEYYLEPTKNENVIRLFKILNNYREQLNNKFKYKIKLCYIFTIQNKNNNPYYDISCECKISGLIGNYNNNIKIINVLNIGINIIDLILINKPTISFYNIEKTIPEQNEENIDNRIEIDDNIYRYLNEKKNLIFDNRQINNVNIENLLAKLILREQHNVLFLINKNEEKNGVLIVDKLNKEETEIFFYQIDDFKIECICPIDSEETKDKTINNDNNNVNNHDNIIIVGGLDKIKRIQKVKYYQMFKNEKMEIQWEEFQDKELSSLNFNSNFKRIYIDEKKLNICTEKHTNILNIKTN